MTTYATAGSAMVTSAYDCEEDAADHTHARLLVFYPNWCTPTQRSIIHL